MNLNLFRDPFAHKIELETALELNLTTHPPRIFLRDEIPDVPKTPIPADFLCMGTMYGIQGKTPGRAVTSTMYKEWHITNQKIDIFEHSFEIPPIVLRHYQMDVPTALDFFRRGKYEIGVCSYLICYKAGEFWLFRLSPFYSELFFKFLEDNREKIKDSSPFIFNLSARELDKKDANGQILWEFEFKHREMIERTLQEAVESEVYKLYLSELLEDSFL